MSAVAPQEISPSDLEAKMRELQGEVESTATSATQVAMVAGAVAVVVVVSIAFLMGRRRGTKKTTVVEVRRL